MTEQVIVISFDHAAVQRVKSLDPRTTTGVLYACRPLDGGVGLARAAQADAVLPLWAYVTREDVDTAHAAGLSVAPWATSDPSVMRELIACGVDAIGTNHPDILQEVLHSVATSRRDGAFASEGGKSATRDTATTPLPATLSGGSPVGSVASDSESASRSTAATPLAETQSGTSDASEGESLTHSNATPPGATPQPLRSDASAGESLTRSRAQPRVAQEPLRSEASDGASLSRSKAVSTTPAERQL